MSHWLCRLSHEYFTKAQHIVGGTSLPSECTTFCIFIIFMAGLFQMRLEDAKKEDYKIYLSVVELKCVLTKETR